MEDWDQHSMENAKEITIAATDFCVIRVLLLNVIAVSGFLNQLSDTKLLIFVSLTRKSLPHPVHVLVAWTTHRCSVPNFFTTTGILGLDIKSDNRMDVTIDRTGE